MQSMTPIVIKKVVNKMLQKTDFFQELWSLVTVQIDTFSYLGQILMVLV